MQRTPLYEAHVRANARIVPFAGYDMPVQYTSVLKEVEAVRTRVGIFDVSHMGRFRVHGDDALKYLQYLTVNDVAKLPKSGGKAQYSLLCKDAGGIIDDIIVYRISLTDFLVVVNAANREKDWKWFQTHHGNFPHAHIEDETDATALVAVQGPHAIDLVDSLSDRDVSSLPRFGLDETEVAGVLCMVARTGYTGEDGVEIFCRAEEARHLWQELTDKGATPCGLGARDTLRLEACYPLYGHEMDETVHPYMARLDWVVKTDKKPDFLGKVALTDLKSAEPKHSLIGLKMVGRAIPRENYPVTTERGKTVGHITSGGFSPHCGGGIAMARVQSSSAELETILNVVIRDTPHPATVVPLPFYKREA